MYFKRARKMSKFNDAARESAIARSVGVQLPRRITTSKTYRQRPFIPRTKPSQPRVTYPSSIARRTWTTALLILPRMGLSSPRTLGWMPRR